MEGFKEAFLWQRSTSNTEEITKGIEIRPWNEQFQREKLVFTKLSLQIFFSKIGAI